MTNAWSLLYDAMNDDVITFDDIDTSTFTVNMDYLSIKKQNQIIDTNIVRILSSRNYKIILLAHTINITLLVMIKFKHLI